MLVLSGDIGPRGRGWRQNAGQTARGSNSQIAHFRLSNIIQKAVIGFLLLETWRLFHILHSPQMVHSLRVQANTSATFQHHLNMTAQAKWLFGIPYSDCALQKDDPPG
jgi:hypothetical protein